MPTIRDTVSVPGLGGSPGEGNGNALRWSCCLRNPKNRGALWVTVHGVTKELDRTVCLPSCYRHVQHFAILWTVACQAPLSMGFSRQRYWSGLPCPPPGDLPNPGIEPMFLMSPALVGLFTAITAWEAPT